MKFEPVDLIVVVIALSLSLGMTLVVIAVPIVMYNKEVQLRPEALDFFQVTVTSAIAIVSLYVGAKLGVARYVRKNNNNNNNKNKNNKNSGNDKQQ